MIVQGDARHLPLKERSVQCVVTSPPYWGLRDYGVEGQLGLEPTPDLYVSHMVTVFREVWRVLRDDGTLWINLGDSYNGYMANQRATSISANNQHARPVFESGRGRRTDDLKAKDLVGIPWRVAFALQADGWYLRSDIIWSKPNPMPESVTDRPTKAHEYLFLLAKSERYYYDAEAIKEPAMPEHAGRYDYDFSGSKEGQDAAMPNGYTIHPKGHREFSGFRNRRSVWTIATQPYAAAHFATFPEDLVKPCILAGAPPGGRVLDPFAGSGTVIKVAQDLGRYGVGVELKPDYITLARDRSSQLGFAALL